MMQRATIIELGGRAFHLDEAGATALEQWMQRARLALNTDPDAEELLLDFERAIAARLEPHAPEPRDVVDEATVRSALAAIGDVEPADDQLGGAAAHPDADADAALTTPLPRVDSNTDSWRDRRLFRLGGDDAMLAGVCAGIAAYLRIDPTIVRAAFVLLTIVTSGVWLFVYLALAFIVPEARTPDERAAATGHGDTARELLERARLRAGEARVRATGMRDQAGPAITRLGAAMSIVWSALVRTARIALLAGFWITVAATVSIAIATLFGATAITSGFDAGTSAWLVAVFCTCVGWFAAGALLWMAMLVPLLDPRTTPSRRASATMHALLGTSWVAAIAAAVTIGAMNSRDMRDMAAGRGSIVLAGQTICADYYPHDQDPNARAACEAQIPFDAEE